MNPVEKFWRWALQPFLAPRELRELHLKHLYLTLSYRRAVAELQELREREQRLAYNRMLPILGNYEAKFDSRIDTLTMGKVLTIRLNPLAINHCFAGHGPTASAEEIPHVLHFCARELAQHMVKKWMEAGVVEKLESNLKRVHPEAIRIRH